MADHVSLIAGSTAGRDHFPFSVQTGDTDVGGFSNFYPISLSLEDACRWFYRVKKWKLAGTLSGQFFSFTNPGNVCVIRSDFDSDGVQFPMTFGEDPEDATREADCVRPWRLLKTTIGPAVEDSSDRITVNSAQLEASPFMFGEVGFGPICFIADLFYIAFYCVINLQCNLTDEGPAPSGPPGTTADTGITFDSLFPGDDPIGTLLVDGAYSLPLTAIYPDVEDFGGEDATAALTLDPVEYWPYAAPEFLPDGVTPHPNAGMPIYDTSDGSQLLDPLTGL